MGCWCLSTRCCTLGQCLVVGPSVCSTHGKCLRKQRSHHDGGARVWMKAGSGGVVQLAGYWGLSLISAPCSERLHNIASAGSTGGQCCAVRRCVIAYFVLTLSRLTSQTGCLWSDLLGGGLWVGTGAAATASSWEWGLAGNSWSFCAVVF
jgi:hypothetical protein